MGEFWSSKKIDPKRSFRWALYLTNLDPYIIKTVAKPSFTINNITHNYAAHTFNYPGRITWNPVSVTLVDPVDPDASSKLVKILQASGYAIPVIDKAAQISFTKDQANVVIGSPTIAQLDASGKTIEEWVLKNAWIESVNFGSLSYESDEMVNIELSFRYDWAEYHGGDKGVVKPVLTPQNESAGQHIADLRTELGQVAGE